MNKDVHVNSAELRSTSTLERIPKDYADTQLLLPPDINGRVEATFIRIQPGKKLANHFFAHKGKKMGYLITGRHD